MLGSDEAARILADGNMTVASELRFDVATVSIDAVQRAAYRLSDRLSVDVRALVEAVEVTLYVGAGLNVDELVAEFRNEVLDQVLRERIRRETEPARNLILALAFSKTGAVPEE